MFKRLVNVTPVSRVIYQNHQAYGGTAKNIKRIIALFQIGRFSLNVVKSYFRLVVQKEFFQHPSAIVDEGAMIGAGTKIWHFCHVMPEAVIGKNCILGQNVFVDNKVVVGDNVKIQNNVSLYNGVTIESEAFIGPSVVFTNVINPRSFIERKSEFKKTVIRKGATLGANATLVCGMEIGEFALVGAGSVITKDVLPFSLVYGNPAKQHGWVSRAGHALHFEGDAAVCPTTGERYVLTNNRVHTV